ncbi:LOW QUALITY PROTEIN: uncharacterized protein LOC116399339 [Xyrichtys novacula]|uniref:LOW QUALITY PROTEIN: uncharacterized protein LOC116399339 n=1 Tax=Xyrichtys novacula TaxID=13765 RepID=A0AAV1GYV2_XYRNO|nr:LOW QUALITY PROTEIN: uncharacterized protein LOC116399339 [Xyrichtys novacula]
MPLDARVKKTSALSYGGPRAQPSKGETPTVAPGSTRSLTTSRRKLLREAVRRRSARSVPRAASQNDSIPQRELEVASTPHLCCATSTSPRSGTEPPIAPLFAPTTVIIGDSITRGIRFFNVTTLSFPGATAADIANKIPSLLGSLPSSIRCIIVHISCDDTARRQSEQTKCDFKRLLNSLKDCGKSVFISGPLPTMMQNCERFSRILSLNSWTNMLCNAQKVHFIDNFNSFWNRPDYSNSDGIHLNSDPQRPPLELLPAHRPTRPSGSPYPPLKPLQRETTSFKIPTIISHRPLRHPALRSSHHANLRTLPRSSQESSVKPPHPHHLNLALFNNRSLTSKGLILQDFIMDNKLDFLFLTETWHKPLDYFSLNQATPTGYTYIDKPRPEGRGGGIATIHKKDLKIISLSMPTVSSFEHVALKLPAPPPPLIIAIIYRPPKPNPDFLTDLSDLLTQLCALSPSILLLGDFNIHIDNPSCSLACEFLDILQHFSFTQHCHFPTHDHGHILALICSTGLETPPPPPAMISISLITYLSKQL